MMIIHITCFLVHMFMDAGLYAFICCYKQKSIVLSSVSLFLQIFLYQGLIFVQQDFMQYKLIPLILTAVPRADLRKNGYFYYFDYFDVMILLDFLTFMCMLCYMFIYLVSSLYPTRNIRALMQLNSAEARSRDYLASDIS